MYSYMFLTLYLDNNTFQELRLHCSMAFSSHFICLIYHSLRSGLECHGYVTTLFDKAFSYYYDSHRLEMKRSQILLTPIFH